MKIEKQKTVAFTGHRQERITTDRNTLFAELYRTVGALYEQGYTTYLTGMAQGFDLLAAEAVWQYRNDTHADIRLVAVIPFRTQFGRFSSEDKHRYIRIASVAECVILSDNYYRGCFHRRNDYLIENAARVVAYYDQTPNGGTHYTVQQAIRKELKVINLYNDTAMIFLADTEKLHDFVTLSKSEFLNKHPQVSEQQYDYAVAVYNLI